MRAVAPVLFVVVLVVASLLLFRLAKGSRASNRPELPPAGPPARWLVYQEAGPARGLARVVSATAATTVLSGSGWRVEVRNADLAAVTRPLLTMAEAEQRVAELSSPAALDTTHGSEQFIRFMKAVSRGTDAEVVAVLRQRYARPYTLSFGDRKMLDALEGRVLPELAHVLGRDLAELTETVRARHPVATASAPPPSEPPWPGKGTDADVPAVTGLEPLGALDFDGQLVIGPRVDRHAEPDAGLARVEVAPGRWAAWLLPDEGAEEASTAALVLMRSGAETRWPVRLTRVATARRWHLAPSAEVQVVDASALGDERVMDAARYLAGTNTYWRKAVTVATLDDVPDTISIEAPAGSKAPFELVVIRLTDGS